MFFVKPFTEVISLWKQMVVVIIPIQLFIIRPTNYYHYQDHIGSNAVIYSADTNRQLRNSVLPIHKTLK